MKTRLNRIMCDIIFETRNLDYGLRSQTDFIRKRVSNSNFGLNSVKYVATKTWDVVPYYIESVEKINLLKKKMEIGNLKDVIAGYANNMFTV